MRYYDDDGDDDDNKQRFPVPIKTDQTHGKTIDLKIID